MLHRIGAIKKQAFIPFKRERRGGEKGEGQKTPSFSLELGRLFLRTQVGADEELAEEVDERTVHNLQ